MVEDLTDRPIDVAVGPGAVVILTRGPVTLTPIAALQSAHRLLEAARQAIVASSPDLEDGD